MVNPRKSNGKISIGLLLVGCWMFFAGVHFVSAEVISQLEGFNGSAIIDEGRQSFGIGSLMVNDGNVNFDGEITARDAQLAFSIAVGSIAPSNAEVVAADCDGDGKVVAGDAQRVFGTALGIGACINPMTSDGSKVGSGIALPVKPSVENYGSVGDGASRANIVWIPNFSGSSSDTVYADIWMQNDTVPVSVFTIDVTFCTTMLAYVATARGTLDPGWIMFGGNESTPGKVTIGAFAMSSIPAGSNGLIARIEFTVTCTACSNGDTCTLQFTRLADNLATFTGTPGVFTFVGGTLPTNTPLPATATPGPSATINAWHIPNSSEACSYDAPMRNPTNPTLPADPVCIYSGVYPVGGASAFTLHYRINSGAWLTQSFTWTCNYGSNDFWWTKCDQGAGQWWVPGGAYGDTVYYYIEVINPGNITTYLYSESTPSRTETLSVAQADPYHFTYPTVATDTPIPPSNTPTVTNSPGPSTNTPVPATETPAPPTVTPTPMTTINAWHIPLSTEACSYNARMRNPSSPVTPTDPVCVYTGVYPIGGASSVTLNYRINTGSWQTKVCEWECNDSPNEFWWTYCDNTLQRWVPGGDFGDRVEYYLTVTSPGKLDTYLHNEASPSRTDDELTAQSLPYYFVYPTLTPTPTPPSATPTSPTATPTVPTNTPTAATNTPIPATVTPAPTATPTGLPTINAWHIPSSAEACAYEATMRDAVEPVNPADPVCIYAGVFPIGGATTFQINYRINGGSWLQHSVQWTCNDDPNDYWWSFCDQSGYWWIPAAAYGDMVEYYITVTHPGFADTYLYSETSPNRTAEESVAQADPYHFTYQIPGEIPAVTSVGAVLVSLFFSLMLLGVSSRRRK